MRTQTIQLLRDGLYRACEAYMNGAIDQHQYNVILINADKLMITLLAIDGIAGTHVVAPVTISAAAPGVSTGASTTAGANGTVAASAGASVSPPYTTIPNNNPAMDANNNQMKDGTGKLLYYAPSGSNGIYPINATAPGVVQSEAIANIVLAVNAHNSHPGLCISLLASGELRLDNPDQHSVLKSCDYLINGAFREGLKPKKRPTYEVSPDAAYAHKQ